jgi:hypothetical protein
MGIIPLHLQRRFEQRWAARFGSQSTCAARGKIQRKTCRIESAGLKSASSGVRLASQGPKKFPNALKFNLIVSTDCEPTSASRLRRSVNH